MGNDKVRFERLSEEEYKEKLKQIADEQYLKKEKENENYYDKATID